MTALAISGHLPGRGVAAGAIFLVFPAAGFAAAGCGGSWTAAGCALRC